MKPNRTRRQRFASMQNSMDDFSRHVIGSPLRRYQRGWAEYVYRAARNHDTETIVVKMARQSGKNEVSARVEGALLATHARIGGDIVKCAPTWKPQIVNSKRRLELMGKLINERLPFLRFHNTQGYITECGRASIQFLSASPSADVVGATSSLLMEVDEAQDVTIVKYNKDFAPMRASTGAPVAMYGTPWTDNTLLEVTAQDVLEKRTRGRVYVMPWSIVAEDHPPYGEFVESEIARLGKSHPLILTQYELKELPGAGRMISSQALRLMIGQHARRVRRTDERQIVAGIDFAGSDEDAGNLESIISGSARDSVALTIAAVEWVTLSDVITVPMLRVVDRYEWQNERPESLLSALVDILKIRWKVNRLHCDETGIGETMTRLLTTALGGDVAHGVKFDAALNSHSRLAFQFLAAINGARFQDYAPDGFDPIAEAGKEAADTGDVGRHAWWQRGHAKLEARPGMGRKVKAHVPESEGHDDLLIADMLCLDAAVMGGQPTDTDALIDVFGWT